MDANDILRKLLDKYNDYPVYGPRFYVDTSDGWQRRGLICLWCSLWAPVGDPEHILGDPARHDPDCAWRQGMELRDKPPACERCKWWQWCSTGNTGGCALGGSLPTGTDIENAQIWAEGWYNGMQGRGEIFSVAKAYCSQFEEAEGEE